MKEAKTKLSIVFTLSVILVLISVLVIAKPNTDRIPATNTNSNRVVVIPEHAVEVAPGIFDLGTSVDKDGRLVQGFAIVDYKKGFHHRLGHSGGPGGNRGTTTSTCFSLLSKGAKWKSLEDWIVNTANTESLTNDFVFNNLGANIQKWEDASSVNILGSGSTTTDVLVADTSSPDNVNEVYFGDIGSPGAIAVTIVWGIFSGPPFARELVEWDQVYDQVDFDWSSTGDANKMDFENIATHELGHTVGLGHPPDECTEETMYRFASEGETKKRTLNSGDIAGINALY